MDYVLQNMNVLEAEFGRKDDMIHSPSLKRDFSSDGDSEAKRSKV